MPALLLREAMLNNIALYLIIGALPCRLLAASLPANGQVSVRSLDGQNRAIVIAEPLARVIAAIRTASVHLLSYRP